MKRIIALMIVAAALVAAPQGAAAQTATIYGQLGNFDVINNTGKDAHGFEIELQGVQPNDVFYAFSVQRYGAPQISASPTGTSTIVRWSSLYDSASQAYYQRTAPYAGGGTFGGTCYQWNGAAYDTAGCEHFGVSLSLGSPKAAYRWLVDNPLQPGTLVPVDPAVPVAQAYYYVQPPQAAAPPVVVAEVQAPEPAESPSRYGDAQWVKVFVQQLPQEVNLDQLMTDNPLVVPMNPAQIEVDWDVIQTEPAITESNSRGNRRRQQKQGFSNLDPTTRSVVRRYELYTYTGAYDPVTHEALCADLTCTAPSAGELGDFVSAQMTAVNVQADYLAVNLVGSGKVQSSDKIIACGSKCTSPYVGGTAVTLAAQPASGFAFSGWTGACAASGNNPTCTVTIQGHVEATASFAASKASGGGGGGGTTTTTATPTLSVAVANKGVVTSDIGGINCGSGGGGCSAKVNQGSAVTLTATPPAGLAFLGWSGACSGTSPVCTLAISSDTKVQASFSK